MHQNGFIRKIRLISNFMTPKAGKKTIEIHKWPNISRSKGKQTMNVGQLIDCNMIKNFLEKSYKKCDADTSTRWFFEKLKLNISLNQ